MKRSSLRELIRSCFLVTALLSTDAVALIFLLLSVCEIYAPHSASLGIYVCLAVVGGLGTLLTPPPTAGAPLTAESTQRFYQFSAIYLAFCIAVLSLIADALLWVFHPESYCVQGAYACLAILTTFPQLAIVYQASVMPPVSPERQAQDAKDDFFMRGVVAK